MIVLILIAVLILWIVFYHEAPYKIRNDNVAAQIKAMPKVISHKAYYQDHLQNTLEGVEAIMNTNIGGIEIDIQISADNVPFLFHDDDLNEITTSKGALSLKKADEIDNIYVAMDGVRSKAPLPRLEKIFQIVGDKKLIILDCKDTHFFNTAFAEVIVDLIHHYDLKATVIVASFNPTFIYKVRQIDPNISTMYTFMTDYHPFAEENRKATKLIHKYREWPLFQRVIRKFVKPDFLNIRFTISDAYRENLLSKHYPIVFWTLDDPKLAIDFTKEGINAIITNIPEKLGQDLGA